MPAVTVALFTVHLSLITALPVAASPGKLARLHGATYPAAGPRAAAATGAVLTLAAAITGTPAAVLP